MFYCYTLQVPRNLSGKELDKETGSSNYWMVDKEMTLIEQIYRLFDRLHGDKVNEPRNDEVQRRSDETKKLLRGTDKDTQE